MTSFVDMFVLFMLQIIKQDKSFYPPTSISSMFHVVGSSICSRQEQHIVKNGVALTIRFNILINAHSHKVKLGAHQAIMQSFKVGLGHTVTKSDILKLE